MRSEITGIGYTHKMRNNMENKTVETTSKGSEAVKQEEVSAPGQGVILVGCLNKKMIDSVTTAAQNQGVEVVMLDDKAVTDYLKLKGVEVPDAEAVTLDSFLSDASNRLVAEQQAAKLWAVMMGNTEVENAEEVEFTETQVVRKTTLSHKKANELFNLLRSFGLLEWTNPKKRVFKLHFSKTHIHNAIHNDILEVSKVINSDILRYKHSIESDNELSEQQRKEKLANLKDAVISSLNF